MYQLYFTTTNKGKVASLQRDLLSLPVELIPVALDIPEIRSDDTAEIAKGKALYAFKQMQKPCVVIDGGFFIPALNGFPRAFVNFAISTIGLAGILKLLEGKDRAAEFRDSLAFIDSEIMEPICFTTVNRGTIALAPRGELHPYNWGELHKIFIPEGQEKTFTEFSPQEMNLWAKGKQEQWCGHLFAQWLLENRLK